MLAIFATCLCGQRSDRPRLSSHFKIGTLLAEECMSFGPRREATMFDREFFTSKLGIAALVSVAAMVTFNILVLAHQLGLSAETVVVAAPMVELA